MAPRLSWRDPIISVVDGVLSRDECFDLIARIEAAGPTPAPVHSASGAHYAPEYRHNDRVMEDDPALAATLFERVKAHVPADILGWKPVGANERLRFYRYKPGHFFAPHRDGSFRRSAGEESLLTLIVYLNGGLLGGETRFLDLDRTVVPVAGRALLFSHPLIHEGAPVRSGIKYAVRSDVMYAGEPTGDDGDD